jgi:CRISPR system Cascade subunit CasB
MSGFIHWLEELNKTNSKARAALRRSLAFDPATYVPAFPYVEPFVKEEESSWRRDMYYLVAGLWAVHWREGRTGEPMSLGKACAAHQIASRSQSTERRFITLLDSDPDQLPHRLRQMVALLKEYPIDFEGIMTGLLYWTDERRRTQTSWARDFYRNLNHDLEPESIAGKENTK